LPGFWPLTRILQGRCRATRVRYRPL
jgi:hypothetical protein